MLVCAGKTRRTLEFMLKHEFCVYFDGSRLYPDAIRRLNVPDGGGIVARSAASRWFGSRVVARCIILHHLQQKKFPLLQQVLWQVFPDALPLQLNNLESYFVERIFNENKDRTDEWFSSVGRLFSLQYIIVDEANALLQYDRLKFPPATTTAAGTTAASTDTPSLSRAQLPAGRPLFSPIAETCAQVVTTHLCHVCSSFYSFLFHVLVAVDCRAPSYCLHFCWHRF